MRSSKIRWILVLCCLLVVDQAEAQSRLQLVRGIRWAMGRIAPTNSKMDVGAIAQRAVAGDVLAQDTLILLGTDSVSRTLKPMLSTSDIPWQDVMGEISLKWTAGLRSGMLADPRRYESWMTTVATNAAHDFAARERSWFRDRLIGDLSVSEFQQKLSTVAKEVAFGAKKSWDARERSELVVSVLHEVGEPHRSLLVDRYWLELDYVAIAERRRYKNEASAKQATYRARRTFARALLETEDASRAEALSVQHSRLSYPR